MGWNQEEGLWESGETQGSLSEAFHVARGRGRALVSILVSISASCLGRWNPKVTLSLYRWELFSYEVMLDVYLCFDWHGNARVVYEHIDCAFVIPFCR